MNMRKNLENLLTKEESVIAQHQGQVTRDPPLVVAQIRAGLLRELLRDLPAESGKGPHSPEKVQSWLVRIVGHEGGYWDDPDAGPTKWGISQKSYPHLDIASLTVQDAEGIYRRDYLAPLQAGLLEDGVVWQLLDFAINSGQPAAVKCLQAALGVTSDGHIGPYTRAAMDKKNESALVMLIIAARLKYMAGLKNLKPNAGGWLNRMANNLLYAVADTDCSVS